MESITTRQRSVAWFATGAMLATAVTLMFVSAWSVDAAPGDEDTTFVPITACRLADTRPAPDRVGPAATIGDGGTQTFTVHGTNGECSIPTDAVAVALNTTAVGATQRSFLTFWPSGDRPLASSLNPEVGQPPTPNAVTVDLSSSGSFNVYNDAGSVNVVLDVTGYYVSSSLTELATRITELETLQPGVLTDSSAGGFLVASPQRLQMAAVVLSAPVDGHVAVTSSATVSDPTSGNLANCWITAADVIDTDFTQAWESSGAGDGDTGSVSGTRVFDITGNETVKYSLICATSAATDFETEVTSAVITATFVPTP